ncbi:MAG: hypothetical protein ACYCR9_04420 [Cuniculiplasma sp.]
MGQIVYFFKHTSICTVRWIGMKDHLPSLLGKSMYTVGHSAIHARKDMVLNKVFNIICEEWLNNTRYILLLPSFFELVTTGNESV